MKDYFFPTVCVDNFFEEPNTFKELSKILNYKKCPNGFWPGKRTDSLHTVSQAVFDNFFSRFFRIYYDLSLEDLEWNANLYFQKIKPFEDPELNKGWIHSDHPCLIGGLVYLNENNDPNSGTSTFSCLNDDAFFLSPEEAEYKRKFFLGENIDIEKYKQLYNNYEKNFVETTRFNYVYNRLVSYDGSVHHRANSFYGNGEEERLTLVFFVNEIKAKTVPLKRNY